MKRSNGISRLGSGLVMAAFVAAGCGAGNNGDGLCGDGVLDAGEQCDDGNLDAGDGCDATCAQESALTEQQQIDGYVRSLGTVEADPATDPVDSEPIEVASPNPDYSCTAVERTQTDQISDLKIFPGQGLESLYPGAIIRGDSLYGGAFTETAFNRAPMTYALNVIDGTNTPRSATMQSPSFSDFQDTFAGLVSSLDLSKDLIDVKFDVKEVHSFEELAIAVGLTVDSARASFDGKFDFNDTSKLSRFVVIGELKFFDAVVDAIPNPSDVFDPSVTAAEVQQKFSDGNPPVYVSSISYGTRIYITIESTLNSTETDLALEAAFNNGAVDVTGQITASFDKVVDKTDINFVGIGVPSDLNENLNALLTSTDKSAAIANLLTSSVTFDAGNVGAPIAFTLKHLADNSFAAMSFTNSFSVPNCIRIAQIIAVDLLRIDFLNLDDEFGDGQDTVEIFGSLNVTDINNPSGGSTTTNLFNSSEDSATIITRDDIDDVSSANTNGLKKFIRINPEVVESLRFNSNLKEDDRGLTASDDSYSGENELNRLDGFNFSAEPYSFSINGRDGEMTLQIFLEPVLDAQ